MSEPGGAPRARKVTFDRSGRLTADTDQAALTATVAYDSVDQPIGATSAAGMRTTMFYDPDGRPTDTYGPSGGPGARRRSVCRAKARSAVTFRGECLLSPSHLSPAYARPCPAQTSEIDLVSGLSA